MNQLRRSLLLRSFVAVVAVLSFTNCRVSPVGFIYGNNATSAAGSSPYIYQIDLANGTILQTYTNLNPAARGGIGVAVIAKTMYYTSATSSPLGTQDCVYWYDLSHGTDQGCFFHVSGGTGPGLASLAFDGQYLWVQEYKPGGRVLQYDINGCDVTAPGANHGCVTYPPPLVASFTPSGCMSTRCDALEVAYIWPTLSLCPVELSVTNRGDRIDPYDAYWAGSPWLCNVPFITPTTRDAGIAWDGAFFYTSDILGQQLHVFNANGTSFSPPTIPPSGGPFGGIPPAPPASVEDLSVDYARIYCFPPKPTVYSNGPANGQLYAYDISNIQGVVVSNSFVIGGTSPVKVTGFCYTHWLVAGDLPQSVNWAITSLPNRGGTVYALGNSSSFALDFLFNNGANNGGIRDCQRTGGCDVYEESVPIPPVSLNPGTYYLNLWYAYTLARQPSYWDVNGGLNCPTPTTGCPSTAFVNSSGPSIFSNAFIIRTD